MIALAASPGAIRAAWRTAVFILKVLPTLPSRPLDFVTGSFSVQKLEYPSQSGPVVGEVYLPAGSGPHPGIVVCLGVVPFGVDHPQVPRLGEALARAGFAALMYWSPHMRDFRLDPEDIENLALAYRELTGQPYVHASSSGLMGTCVGGSFALMAAASPSIRERVAFAAAFAPYGSLFTLARSIASSTCVRDEHIRPWQVDPLTRKVFVHSVTASLKSSEARALREAFETSSESASSLEPLSDEGRAVKALLAARDLPEANDALDGLPETVRSGLQMLSPCRYLPDIRAPLIAISHDRDDSVIPIAESRLLHTSLAGRAGVHYTEFAMFQHADPTGRRLAPHMLLLQLSKFYLWLYRVFRAAAL